jgi:hypothetical protein
MLHCGSSASIMQNRYPRSYDRASLAVLTMGIVPFAGRNIMSRTILGVCGFLFFGTFGMLSGVAQVHHDECVAPSETIGLQGNGIQRQKMSDEERERRQKECARMYEYCHD